MAEISNSHTNSGIKGRVSFDAEEAKCILPLGQHHHSHPSLLGALASPVKETMLHWVYKVFCPNLLIPFILAHIHTYVWNTAVKWTNICINFVTFLGGRGYISGLMERMCLWILKVLWDNWSNYTQVCHASKHLENQFSIFMSRPHLLHQHLRAPFVIVTLHVIFFFLGDLIYRTLWSRLNLWSGREKGELILCLGVVPIEMEASIYQENQGTKMHSNNVFKVTLVLASHLIHSHNSRNSI